MRSLLLFLLLSLALSQQLVDIVFIMDTSGSMWDDASAMCNAMNGVKANLLAAGLDVRVMFWAINYIYSFPCLTSTVVAQLGTSFTGSNICSVNHEESWAPATAIVAEKFAWRAGAFRMISPVSDECPCYGDPLYTDDVNSVTNAINVAQANSVCVAPLVAPMYGSSYHPDVVAQATRLATATGCNMYKLGNVNDMVSFITNMIVVSVQTPPPANCANRVVPVDTLGGCKAYADVNADVPNSQYTYSYSVAAPYPVGVTSVTMTVTDPNTALSASCTATVTVEDTTPACTVCLNELVIEAMNVSYAQTIATRVDKQYLYVTITGPVVRNREVLGYAIAQEIGVGYQQGPCDYYPMGLPPTKALWKHWRQGCNDIWEGRFLLANLVACGATVTSTSTTQKVEFLLYPLIRDHFDFGYVPTDTPRLVTRPMSVQVIFQNFVSGKLSFVIHAPPEVLNAIIRERYDVVRGVYEIDVIKVVQSHFEIVATGVTGTYSGMFTLVTDVTGDGSTDRLEVVTPPPCRFPSSFSIKYDIRCHAMVCRDNTWNKAAVDFIIPNEEFCPEVSVTYSPQLGLKLCADAACSTFTSNHILGYVMTLQATVTMIPPIKKTEFYDVYFTDSSSLSKYAKLSNAVTPFGVFLNYVDTVGGSNGVSTCDWVPRKGTGANLFWSTPDIFTPSNYEVSVVMYVEANLDQQIASRFHIAKLRALAEPTAESYARAQSELAVADSEDAFATASEASSNTGLIVGLVVGAVALAFAFAGCIVYRRRNSIAKAETHVQMTS